MRFFKPNLAMVNLSSITYHVKSSDIERLVFSENLDTFLVFCKGTRRARSIKKELSQLKNNFPFKIALSSSSGLIKVSGLRDIRLEMVSTIEALQKEDPIFLRNLEAVDQVSDEHGEEFTSDFLISQAVTPSRCKFFSLQGLRADGLNHAVESYLKTLSANAQVSQEDLNQVLPIVYRRINDMRAQSAASEIALPQPGSRPLVFKR